MPSFSLESGNHERGSRIIFPIQFMQRRPRRTNLKPIATAFEQRRPKCPRTEKWAPLTGRRPGTARRANPGTVRDSLGTARTRGGTARTPSARWRRRTTTYPTGSSINPRSSSPIGRNCLKIKSTASAARSGTLQIRMGRCTCPT